MPRKSPAPKPPPASRPSAPAKPLTREEAFEQLFQEFAAGRITLADIDAEIERKTELEAKADFGKWLEQASPRPWHWEWNHLAHIRKYLAKVTSGEIKRLMIFVPPQHGKSEQTTVRYPVWRLEKNPALRVAIACYNRDHAKRFSRKSRKIAIARKVSLEKDKQAAHEWGTAEGGGFLAVGVGTGIAGNPVDLLVIDDPVKNREEAESETYRERVKDWYADDLYTRLQHDAPIIVIQTRWHEDDLSGYLLSGPDASSWTVVNLPAEAEENDPLGRRPGEPLCPQRFTAADLRDRRRVLGDWSYEALYQQRPTPRGGGMIQREWLSRVVTSVPEGCSFVRYWDKAGTESRGDWTVGLLMARDPRGLYYIVDMIRGQWNAPRREEMILATARADEHRYGFVRVGIEQEPGSGGKESAEGTIRNLAGFSVWSDRPTGEKHTRLEPFAAQAGPPAYNVRLVMASWNAHYLSEVCVFPGGKHDDCVDATSGAFNQLAGKLSIYETRGLLVFNGEPEKRPQLVSSLVDDTPLWVNPDRDDWLDDD